MENPIISEFGFVALFLITSIAFVVICLQVFKLLRPHKPNTEKNSTYESGEEPIGGGVFQISAGYYITSIVFLLFEVELLYLFPWSTIYAQKELIEMTNGQWLQFTIAEILIFIFLLVLGFAYVWRKGHLDWILNENQKKIDNNENIEIYQKVNQKYS